MAPQTLQTLRQLHDLIGASLSTIEKAYSDASVAYPSLDDIYVPTSPEEKLLFHPEVANASTLLVSAAEQIIASIKPPQITLSDNLMAYQLPAAIAYAERLNVVEALNKAGSNGMHLSELAAITGSSETKLEQVMRLLATHYIFREVEIGRFVNNRLSSLVDTGHPFDSLPLPSSPSKYRNTSGSAAWVAVAGDEMFKAAAYQNETYINSPTKDISAFSRAFGTNKSYFEWLNEPANSKYLERFRYLVLGVSLFEHPEALVDAFDWASLPSDSLIVDIGGGLGPATLKLVNAFPHLKYLIQDQQSVVDASPDHWLRVNPEAWNSKRVQASAHNFLEPQPVKDASVFLLRAICHGQADEAVIKILSHLRAAASLKPGFETTLIIGDHIMAPTIPDTTLAVKDTPGAQKRLGPEPLLANLGKASASATYMDLTMQTLLLGKERSLSEQVDICRASGWVVQKVSLNDISRFSYIVARPE